MIIRRSEQRGQGDYGWLKARYSFSFAQYVDHKWLGFRSLRVINEDRVQGGAGFQTHGHRDMEILTWVLEGRLRHRDSEGNEAVLEPGRIQRMSAGTGIRHSEVNDSEDEELHLLQIWIEPETEGLAAGYEECDIPVVGEPDRWHLAASPAPRSASGVHINQDAELRIARLRSGASVSHDLRPDRAAWIQVARGRVNVGDVELRAGDGAAIEESGRIEIKALEGAELLLFDLA